MYDSNGRDIHGHEMTGFGGGTINDAPGQVRVCFISYNELADVAPPEF